MTAAQRAGTTALQHAFRATGIQAFGEIFHPEPLPDAQGSFLAFLRENQIQFGDLRTRAAAIAMAERYLAWLRTLAAEKHFAIDVKLNSWTVLRGWWRYSNNEPLFLRQLKCEGAAIIFVWRESLAEQLLSHFIALEFNLWHNLTPASVSERRLNAPVTRLQNWAEGIIRAETDILQHLETYSAKLVIRYEELFSETHLSGKLRSEIRRISGIRIPKDTPVPVRRNTASKREIIENYGDVIEAIRPLEQSRRQVWEKRGFLAC